MNLYPDDYDYEQDYWESVAESERLIAKDEEKLVKIRAKKLKAEIHNPAPQGMYLVINEKTHERQRLPVEWFKSVDAYETVWLGRYSLRVDGKPYPYVIREDGNPIAEGTNPVALFAMMQHLHKQDKAAGSLPG